ncbi:unnamed protein product [Calicophoron daubneyi]|uniref:Uncharacterized protein n=1 Tax=Calicophoron daubneyi TaxID=300641 RepID=A0AAV2T1G2_CALDB
MTSVKLLDRVELEKYLRSLKATAEGPVFRTTQKSLEFELFEQRSAAEEAQWLTQTLSPNEQGISDLLQGVQDDVEINEAGLEYLTGITAMEQLYSNISALVAARSCDLALKGMEPPYSLRSTLTQFEYFGREAERLYGRSHMVVPIYMRSQPLTSEAEGIMLCDYDMGDFSFRAGDRVVVLNNNVTPSTTTYTSSVEEASYPEDAQQRKSPSAGSDGSNETVEIIDVAEHTESELSEQNVSSMLGKYIQPASTDVSSYWQVRGVNDSVIRKVPAVCVWITTADPDAKITAEKLMEELLLNWKATIDRLLQVVCNFMRRFLNRIIDCTGVCVTDGVALMRLFTLLEESYPDSPVWEYNREMTALLQSARHLWKEVPEKEAKKSRFSLKRSEIAQYISIIELLHNYSCPDPPGPHQDG